MGGDPMSGQRRANWRAEAAQMVAALDERLLVRIEADAALHNRRAQTVASALADFGNRIGKLERRKRIESWIAAGYVCGMALLVIVPLIWKAVTR